MVASRSVASLEPQLSKILWALLLATAVDLYGSAQLIFSNPVSVSSVLQAASSMRTPPALASVLDDIPVDEFLRLLSRSTTAGAHVYTQPFNAIDTTESTAQSTEPTAQPRIRRGVREQRWARSREEIRRRGRGETRQNRTGKGSMIDLGQRKHTI